MVQNFKFKLDNLPDVILGEVFGYMGSEDQIELLLCNKKCHNLFIPILWENLNSIYMLRSEYTEEALRSNGKYIKDLNIFSFEKLPVNTKCFPNAINLYTSLSDYLKNQAQYSHLRFNKLAYFDNNIYNENLVPDYDTLKNILRDVEELEGFMDEYFINNILKSFPIKIHKLDLEFNRDKLFLLKDILDTFNNIKDLTINSYEGFDNKSILFNTYFSGLINLKLVCHVSNLGTNIEINFNQFPNLQRLSLLSFSQVIFINNSHLHSLHLFIDNPPANLLQASQFPKLKQLIFNSIVVSHPLFHSLLSIPTITYLKFSPSSIGKLSPELFDSNYNSSLITLVLYTFEVDVDLINCFFESCKHLSNIYLDFCKYKVHFDADMFPKGFILLKRKKRCNELLIKKIIHY